jgi:hypothetical protein
MLKTIRLPALAAVAVIGPDGQLAGFGIDLTPTFAAGN